MVISSELGFAVSFTVCHLLTVFFSVTLGQERPIFEPLATERDGQIQACLISLDGDPSSGKMAIGPFYLGRNPVEPVYSCLGISNRGAEALS